MSKKDFDEHVNELAEKYSYFNSGEYLIDAMEDMGYGVWFPLCDHPAFRNECKETDTKQKEKLKEQEAKEREEDGHVKSD